ncbi:H-type lectin domain-containing protein, partial [Candidatus Falkowbacteria bacterium]|nr:H-type lectin domain-containing protein [Candidatus Falkowbacteria bacterium]
NGAVFVDGSLAGVVIDDRTTGTNWQLYGATTFNLYNGSNPILTVSTSGGMNLGISDNTGGSLGIYGNGTANAEGGQLELYNAADYDTTFQSWNIDAYQDDLRIFSSDAVALHTFTAGGGLTLDGSLINANSSFAIGVSGDSDTITMTASNVDIEENLSASNRIRAYRASTTAEFEVGTRLAIAGAAVQSGYGLKIGSTEATTWPIFDDSTAHLTPAGIWTDAPSWSWYKDEVATTTSYLEKFRQLAVNAWQYKDEEVDGMNRYKNDKFVHVSPYLDDFNAIFGIGVIQGINNQDWIGVTMAGLKELDQVVLDMADEINQMKLELDLIVSTSTSSSSEELVVNEEPIINPDLDINTLIVRQAATFYGTITVLGDALFEHNVVFNQDVEIKGKLYAGRDQAGTAMIPANSTSTEILFETPYEVIPKIVASLKGDTLILHGIKNITEQGFTIHIAEPATTDLTFDWIALATKELAQSAPPVIDEFITSSDTAGLGVTVELWAKVTDSDTAEADLTYSWNFSPNIGTLNGEGGLVYWKVESGITADTDVAITVTVSDGSSSASSSKVVRVIYSEIAPPAEQTPPEPTSTTTESTVVYGCIDPTALNYDSSATSDDGSCAYPESVVLGCTDPNANNYNVNATEDDGSCSYSIAGCTDPTAENYNADATADNGSCSYPEPVVVEEPASTTTPPVAQEDGNDLTISAAL